MNLQTLIESKTGRLIVALCRYVQSHGNCSGDASLAAIVLRDLLDDSGDLVASAERANLRAVLREVAPNLLPGAPSLLCERKDGDA